jgi:hypothetical protein
MEVRAEVCEWPALHRWLAAQPQRERERPRGWDGRALHEATVTLLLK